MISMKSVAWGVLLALTFFIGSASADFITPLTTTVTPLQNGYNLYNYIVENESDEDIFIQSFTVEVSSDANLVSLQGPDGWQIYYIPGDTSILWSTGPDLDLVIQPSQAESFSFMSALKPITLNYDIFGIDIDAQFPYDNIGLTASPGVAIPESVSMIPLGTGLVALACFSGYRRWQATPLDFLFSPSSARVSDQSAPDSISSPAVSYAPRR